MSVHQSNQRKSNRLIREKSPYLLQHAHQPVNWFPWGEEAFQKAKKEDKPVFLSIGYSTCHWCHVMARESFEDEEVAAILNRDFVPVKVDREERPDVDQVYMTVCQAMTGQGGWPLTIIMTPEQKPFFAGTYLPKQTMYGRMGLIDLLKRVSMLWKEERNRADEVGDKIVHAVKSYLNAAEAGRWTWGSSIMRMNSSPASLIRILEVSAMSRSFPARMICCFCSGTTG